jgi:hypothetical protein
MVESCFGHGSEYGLLSCSSPALELVARVRADSAPLGDQHGVQSQESWNALALDRKGHRMGSRPENVWMQRGFLLRHLREVG